MPTIVSGTVPAEEFALAHTQETIPDALFEIECTVSTGSGTVMPMLWARGVPRERVAAAFEEDPSIESFELLEDFADEGLFRVEWANRIGLVVKMLTHSGANVLDAVGSDGRWQLRVLYQRRELFSETYGFCEDHGLRFDVESIRELEGKPGGRFGLTTQQYEVLAAAIQSGYFEVPRGATLEEIADGLNVSHQAASERLRRATAALVENALFAGQDPQPVEPAAAEAPGILNEPEGA